VRFGRRKERGHDRDSRRATAVAKKVLAFAGYLPGRCAVVMWTLVVILDVSEPLKAYLTGGVSLLDL
jgi:hypothetical protein